MNERIGNNRIYVLAKEAGLIEFEQLDWNPDLGSPTYESVAKARKFAELIVKECARVAQNTDLEDVEGGDSAVLLAASKHVKQHFGVN